MKSAHLLFALALGVSSGVTPAQPAPPVPERQTVKIIQTTTPIFPYGLIEMGYSYGEVRVAISVDDTGKLTDWLVVSYTHRRFADEAVGALKQWRYEPARVQGRAVSTQFEVAFNFESTGAIVSYDPGSYMQKYTNSLFLGRDAYGPCTLRELDRIPTPLKTVHPAYHNSLASQGVRGSVTVEFFIDESGRIRMPAIVTADRDELALLAVEALQQWQFEPPTCKGQPVLVRAKQVFHFGLKKS